MENQFWAVYCGLGWAGLDCEIKESGPTKYFLWGKNQFSRAKGRDKTSVLLSVVSSQHSLFSTLKIISTGGPISFFFELVALWLVGESFLVITFLELSVFYLKFISGLKPSPSPLPF